MTLEEIKKCFLNVSNFSIKNILDNSHKHSNHISVKNSKIQLTHIEINVIILKKTLSRLEVHREIFLKLQKFIDMGLHSIEIKIIKE